MRRKQSPEDRLLSLAVSSAVRHEDVGTRRIAAFSGYCRGYRAAQRDAKRSDGRSTGKKHNTREK